MGSTDWRYVDIPGPEPVRAEVRVRIRAAAFNRLDRFTLEGIPGVPIALPHVLGSDGAGTVDRAGGDVQGLAEGTKVLLNPGMWDGTCPACLAGREALCRNDRILGEHVQGTVTSFAVVPRRNVHPLPDRMSFEEGAASPLVFLTAWRALKTVGEVRPGDRVAVVGAGGGIPTAAVQVAKLLGARVAVVAALLGQGGQGPGARGRRLLPHLFGRASARPGALGVEREERRRRDPGFGGRPDPPPFGALARASGPGGRDRGERRPQGGTGRADAVLATSFGAREHDVVAGGV